MKPPILLLAGASVAAAQEVAAYFPECSIDCLADSTSAVSDCSFDDAWCICVQSTYEVITAHATSCVMQACGADVAVGEVLPAAVPYCEAATANHQSGSLPTTTPSSDAGRDSQSNTPDAGDVDSADLDEEDDDSGAERAVAALLGMSIVAATAAFQVWA